MVMTMKVIEPENYGNEGHNKQIVLQTSRKKLEENLET